MTKVNRAAERVSSLYGYIHSLYLLTRPVRRSHSQIGSSTLSQRPGTTICHRLYVRRPSSLNVCQTLLNHRISNLVPRPTARAAT